MKNAKGTGYLGYGIVAIILLVILTAAILTPDYLNYKYRIAHLTAAQAKPTQRAQCICPPIVASPVNSTQASSGDSRSADENHESKALSTADIFETYGKLITMLLGFVSAVGVLVGYFIKTSIRELIEDARSDNEREVGIFKSEKERILNEIKETKAQTEETLKKTLEVQKEYEQKLKEAKALLDALEVAAKTYNSTSQKPKDDPAAMAAKVDSEL